MVPSFALLFCVASLTCAPPPASAAPQDEAPPPAAAPLAQGRALGPVRISGGVMAGQLLTRINPLYPPEAKQKGMEGTVVMSARIGKDGTVRDLQVISGPAILAEAAANAVRQWTYRPYLLNGNPTEVNTTITVNFRLSAPPPPASVPEP